MAIKNLIRILLIFGCLVICLIWYRSISRIEGVTWEGVGWRFSALYGSGYIFISYTNLGSTQSNEGDRGFSINSSRMDPSQAKFISNVMMRYDTYRNFGISYSLNASNIVADGTK